MLRSLITVTCTAVIVALSLGATCNPKPILSDLAKCEGSVAGKDAPALIPILGSILASGGTNAVIDAALLGLVAQFGVDSVDCGVVAVLAGLAQVMGAAATQPGSMKAAAPTLAVARGTAWLGTRGASKRTVAP